MLGRWVDNGIAAMNLALNKCEKYPDARILSEYSIGNYIGVVHNNICTLMYKPHGVENLPL